MPAHPNLQPDDGQAQEQEQEQEQEQAAAAAAKKQQAQDDAEKQKVRGGAPWRRWEGWWVDQGRRRSVDA